MSPVAWFYVDPVSTRVVRYGFGFYEYHVAVRYQDGTWQDFNHLTEETWKMFKEAGRQMPLMAGYYWPKRRLLNGGS